MGRLVDAGGLLHDASRDRARAVRPVRPGRIAATRGGGRARPPGPDECAAGAGSPAIDRAIPATAGPRQRPAVPRLPRLCGGRDARAARAHPRGDAGPGRAVGLALAGTRNGASMNRLPRPSRVPRPRGRRITDPAGLPRPTPGTQAVRGRLAAISVRAALSAGAWVGLALA